MGRHACLSVEAGFARLVPTISSKEGLPSVHPLARSGEGVSFCGPWSVGSNEVPHKEPTRGSPRTAGRREGRPCPRQGAERAAAARDRHLRRSGAGRSAHGRRTKGAGSPGGAGALVAAAAGKTWRSPAAGDPLTSVVANAAQRSGAGRCDGDRGAGWLWKQQRRWRQRRKHRQGRRLRERQRRQLRERWGLHDQRSLGDEVDRLDHRAGRPALQRHPTLRRQQRLSGALPGVVLARRAGGRLSRPAPESRRHRFRVASGLRQRGRGRRQLLGFRHGWRHGDLQHLPGSLVVSGDRGRLHHLRQRFDRRRPSALRLRPELQHADRRQLDGVLRGGRWLQRQPAGAEQLLEVRWDLQCRRRHDDPVEHAPAGDAEQKAVTARRRCRRALGRDDQHDMTESMSRCIRRPHRTVFLAFFSLLACASNNMTGSGSTDNGGTTCALPTTFKWTAEDPLATPKAPAGQTWVALKDFSDVVYKDMHIVYMSTHDTATSYGSAMFTFSDWPHASAATQLPTPHGVAPTLFYFAPKNTWVLAYQWGATPFSYVTSSDPTNPGSWSSEQALFTGKLSSASPTGPIDQTVICNSTTC